MQVVICNTSPLQYLHQADLLNVLPDLFESVQIPLAVAVELAQGGRHGIDLPEIKLLPWLSLKSVSGNPRISQITNLGKGEKEVIALGLESSNPLLVLDDGKARRFATSVGLEITGTMGFWFWQRNEV